MATVLSTLVAVVNLVATFALFRTVRYSVRHSAALVCGHRLRHVKGVRLGNGKSALCTQELVQGS